MIRARGKGTWQVVVYAGTDTLSGKERRVRRTVHGSKRDAEDVERQLTLDARVGVVDDPRKTVADALAAWLEHAGPDLAVTTLYNYRRIIDDKMASAIRKEVTLRGYRPTDFTLFAFGGGGPTHAAGYMGEIPRAVMFPFSPVFCAYGSSIMDVVHLYERSHRMMLLAPLTTAELDDEVAIVTG